jgi:maltooligosyltrehalose trehalohydrolase
MEFKLWAPALSRAALLLGDARHEMRACGDGWFACSAPARTGDRYWYDTGELRVPDPASRFQPEGVHAPGEVVDPDAYAWRHAWSGRAWNELVFYELHVGTFTREGTFRAAIERLDDLRELGVTALELMPVAQASGRRGWGYDGVFPFAPHCAYGRPDDLKALVDAAHGKGLAVFLDVVYNHFGPDGNYLHHYAPQFFTDRHHTPWGSAINLDGPGSAVVRDFLCDNALYWLQEFRFDGLRLDAVHELRDDSPKHFLVELAERVRAAIQPGRRVHLVLENDDNAARFLDDYAQWNDDAHHVLHVAVTEEREGYYRDYGDPVRALGRVLAEGFAYQGEFSQHRGRPRGEPSAHLHPAVFVDFLQNHDQIGNRALGERITALAPWERVKAAVTIMLLAPSIPLLFMGEEWGASTPFLYFCDFTGDLARAVTEGRRREYPGSPDPNDPATFERSKLNWDERSQPPHREIAAFYRETLALRRAQVVPLLEKRCVDASYELLGPSVVRVRWTFEGPLAYTLVADLERWKVEWSIA